MKIGPDKFLGQSEALMASQVEKTDFQSHVWAGIPKLDLSRWSSHGYFSFKYDLNFH